MRKIFIIICSGLLAFSLVACNVSGESTATATTDSTLVSTSSSLPDITTGGTEEGTAGGVTGTSQSSAVAGESSSSAALAPQLAPKAPAAPEHSQGQKPPQADEVIPLPAEPTPAEPTPAEPTPPEPTPPEPTPPEPTPPEPTPPESTTEPTALEENDVSSIKVAVGSKTFSATLAENVGADAFVELLQGAPIVLQMSDYAGFEKVANLGTSLPTSNRQTNSQAGDIVLYNGNQIVVFYGSNSWSYTRLARINDLSGWAEALGGGDVTVTFSLK